MQATTPANAILTMRDRQLAAIGVFAPICGRLGVWY